MTMELNEVPSIIFANESHVHSKTDSRKKENVETLSFASMKERSSKNATDDNLVSSYRSLPKEFQLNEFQKEDTVLPLLKRRNSTGMLYSEIPTFIVTKEEDDCSSVSESKILVMNTEVSTLTSRSRDMLYESNEYLNSYETRFHQIILEIIEKRSHGSPVCLDTKKSSEKSNPQLLKKNSKRDFENRSTNSPITFDRFRLGQKTKKIDFDKAKGKKKSWNPFRRTPSEKIPQSLTPGFYPPEIEERIIGKMDMIAASKASQGKWKESICILENILHCQKESLGHRHSKVN